MAYLFHTDRKPTVVWKQLGIHQTRFIHAVELHDLRGGTLFAFAKGLESGSGGQQFWLTVGKGEGGEGGPDHDRWTALETVLEDPYHFEDAAKVDAELWYNALLRCRHPAPGAVADTLKRIDDFMANARDLPAYRDALIDAVRRAHGAFLERQPDHADTRRIGEFLRHFEE